jgi:hypothetical protein
LLVRLKAYHTAELTSRILPLQYSEGQLSTLERAELIEQEAELPTNRTYLFGYHPHGIIGM